MKISQSCQVEVPSHFGSKVTKRCWLIRSNKVDTTKAFVLMHGWFGNMQSCLHFADTLKKVCYYTLRIPMRELY